MKRTTWLTPIVAMGLCLACEGGRSDEAISEDFARLAEAAPALAGAEIQALTDDGRITLRGTVPSEHARESAEHIASEIMGVKGVRNEVRVLATAPAVPEPRSVPETAPEPTPPSANERILPPSIEPESGDLAPSPDVPPKPTPER